MPLVVQKWFFAEINFWVDMEGRETHHSFPSATNPAPFVLSPVTTL